MPGPRADCGQRCSANDHRHKGVLGGALCLHVFATVSSGRVPHVVVVTQRDTASWVWQTHEKNCLQEFAATSGSTKPERPDAAAELSKLLRRLRPETLTTLLQGFFSLLFSRLRSLHASASVPLFLLQPWQVVVASLSGGAYEEEDWKRRRVEGWPLDSAAVVLVGVLESERARQNC